LSEFITRLNVYKNTWPAELTSFWPVLTNDLIQSKQPIAYTTINIVEETQALLKGIIDANVTYDFVDYIQINDENTTINNYAAIKIPGPFNWGYNTGVYADDMEITFRFLTPFTSTSANRILFAYNADISEYPTTFPNKTGVALTWNTNRNWFELNQWYANTTNNVIFLESMLGDLTQWYVIDRTITNNTYKWREKYETDTSWGWESSGGWAGLYSIPYMYLGILKGEIVAPTLPTVIQIKNVKISNQGTVRYQLYAAKRNTDGVYGLYDIVTEQFFPSITDTPIIGPT
jgi:hypothetical protein